MNTCKSTSAQHAVQCVRALATSGAPRLILLTGHCKTGKTRILEECATTIVPHQDIRRAARAPSHTHTPSPSPPPSDDPTWEPPASEASGDSEEGPDTDTDTPESPSEPPTLPILGIDDAHLLSDSDTAAFIASTLGKDAKGPQNTPRTPATIIITHAAGARVTIPAPLARCTVHILAPRTDADPAAKKLQLAASTVHHAVPKTIPDIAKFENITRAIAASLTPLVKPLNGDGAPNTIVVHATRAAAETARMRYHGALDKPHAIAHARTARAEHTYEFTKIRPGTPVITTTEGGAQTIHIIQRIKGDRTRISVAGSPHSLADDSQLPFVDASHIDIHTLTTAHIAAPHHTNVHIAAPHVRSPAHALATLYAVVRLPMLSFESFPSFILAQ